MCFDVGQVLAHFWLRRHAFLHLMRPATGSQWGGVGELTRVEGELCEAH